MGARCVAEEILFLTLVRRPLDSDDATEPPSLGSEWLEPRDSSEESLWLDRFLSNMVSGY